MMRGGYFWLGRHDNSITGLTPAPLPGLGAHCVRCQMSVPGPGSSALAPASAPRWSQDNYTELLRHLTRREECRHVLCFSDVTLNMSSRLIFNLMKMQQCNQGSIVGENVFLENLSKDPCQKMRWTSNSTRSNYLAILCKMIITELKAFYHLPYHRGLCRNSSRQKSTISTSQYWRFFKFCILLFSLSLQSYAYIKLLKSINRRKMTDSSRRNPSFPSQWP